MSQNYIPLSQFGVLVAQLESIVASAAHKSPDPLLCFDLLSDLISAINDEPKVFFLSPLYFLHALLDQCYAAAFMSKFHYVRISLFFFFLIIFDSQCF